MKIDLLLNNLILNRNNETGEILKLLPKDVSDVSDILIDIIRNIFNHHIGDVLIIKCVIYYIDGLFSIYTDAELFNNYGGSILVYNNMNIQKDILIEILKSHDKYYFRDSKNKKIDIVDIIQIEEVNQSAKPARIRKDFR